MTTERESEDELLAAEHALGLLEGSELVEARLRFRSDPAFAAAVARWEERLAPMLDEAGAEDPRPELWERISREIERGARGGEVVALRQWLGRWRGYSIAMSAVAASLALVVGYQAAREPPAAVAPEPRQVLFATLASEDEPTALSVAIDPGAGTLLVTPARLAGASGHDHELWLVPAEGDPLSLGLVRGGEPHRLPLRPEFHALVGPNAALALSVEPEGGSPTGLPTGPVIAAGTINRI
jgi:anti-sigma-K factor RskA